MAIYNGGLNIVAQDISGKEDKSNKVTTWSSTTTDTNYPSEKLVKSALDTKVNTSDALTYEEIMASNPVPDLSGKVTSASALKSLSNESYGSSSLRSYLPFGAGVNIDDIGNYPRGKMILCYSLFTYTTTGAKPFSDGHLLSFIWDNLEGGETYITQVAIEDDNAVIKIRSYNTTAKTWQSWKTVSIS